MTRKDGEFVAEAALDAIAAVEERIPGSPKLIGLQITLIVQTPTGVRFVNTIKELRR